MQLGGAPRRSTARPYPLPGASPPSRAYRRGGGGGAPPRAPVRATIDNRLLRAPVRATIDKRLLRARPAAPAPAAPALRAPPLTPALRRQLEETMSRTFAAALVLARKDAGERGMPGSGEAEALGGRHVDSVMKGLGGVQAARAAISMAALGMPPWDVERYLRTSVGGAREMSGWLEAAAMCVGGDEGDLEPGEMAEYGLIDDVIMQFQDIRLPGIADGSGLCTMHLPLDVLNGGAAPVTGGRLVNASAGEVVPELVGPVIPAVSGAPASDAQKSMPPPAKLATSHADFKTPDADLEPKPCEARSSVLPLSSTPLSVLTVDHAKGLGSGEEKACPGLRVQTEPTSERLASPVKGMALGLVADTRRGVEVVAEATAQLDSADKSPTAQPGTASPNGAVRVNLTEQGPLSAVVEKCAANSAETGSPPVKPPAVGTGQNPSAVVEKSSPCLKEAASAAVAVVQRGPKDDAQSHLSNRARQASPLRCQTSLKYDSAAGVAKHAARTEDVAHDALDSTGKGAQAQAAIAPSALVVGKARPKGAENVAPSESAPSACEGIAGSSGQSASKCCVVENGNLMASESPDVAPSLGMCGTDGGSVAQKDGSGLHDPSSERVGTPSDALCGKRGGVEVVAERPSSMAGAAKESASTPTGNHGLEKVCAAFPKLGAKANERAPRPFLHPSIQVDEGKDWLFNGAKVCVSGGKELQFCPTGRWSAPTHAFFHSLIQERGVDATKRPLVRGGSKARVAKNGKSAPKSIGQSSRQEREDKLVKKVRAGRETRRDTAAEASKLEQMLQRASAAPEGPSVDLSKGTETRRTALQPLDGARAPKKRPRATGFRVAVDSEDKDELPARGAPLPKRQRRSERDTGKEKSTGSSRSLCGPGSKFVPSPVKRGPGTPFVPSPQERRKKVRLRVDSDPKPRSFLSVDEDQKPRRQGRRSTGVGLPRVDASASLVMPISDAEGDELLARYGLAPNSPSLHELSSSQLDSSEDDTDELNPSLRGASFALGSKSHAAEWDRRPVRNGSSGRREAASVRNRSGRHSDPSGKARDDSVDGVGVDIDSDVGSVGELYSTLKPHLSSTGVESLFKDDVCSPLNNESTPVLLDDDDDDELDETALAAAASRRAKSTSPREKGRTRGPASKQKAAQPGGNVQKRGRGRPSASSRKHGACSDGDDSEGVEFIAKRAFQNTPEKRTTSGGGEALGRGHRRRAASKKAQEAWGSGDAGDDSGDDSDVVCEGQQGAEGKRASSRRNSRAASTTTAQPRKDRKEAPSPSPPARAAASTSRRRSSAKRGASSAGAAPGHPTSKTAAPKGGSAAKKKEKHKPQLNPIQLGMLRNLCGEVDLDEVGAQQRLELDEWASDARAFLAGRPSREVELYAKPCACEKHPAAAGAAGAVCLESLQVILYPNRWKRVKRIVHNLSPPL